MAGYRRPTIGERLGGEPDGDGIGTAAPSVRLRSPLGLSDDAVAARPDAPLGLRGAAREPADGGVTRWVAGAPYPIRSPELSAAATMPGNGTGRERLLELEDVRHGTSRQEGLSLAGLTRLARTIESEVVPNLVRASRAQRRSAARQAPRGRVPDADDVAEFAGLVLVRGDRIAASYIDWLRLRGTSMESIYLDLLAPSARHLGTLWEEDLADFTQVTVGLGRLQQIMREMSPAFLNEVDLPLSGRRALILPVAGEQHTFGLLMVADFFARAGWAVKMVPSATQVEAAALVRREAFGLVGFSLSNERLASALEAEIRVVRHSSSNAKVSVMVGGPVFVENPDLAARLGADATASDGRSAVATADAMVAAQV